MYYPILHRTARRNFIFAYSIRNTTRKRSMKTRYKLVTRARNHVEINYFTVYKIIKPDMTIRSWSTEEGQQERFVSTDDYDATNRDGCFAMCQLILVEQTRLICDQRWQHIIHSRCSHATGRRKRTSPETRTGWMTGCWRQVARLIGPFLRSGSTGLEYEAAPIWIRGSSLLMGKLLTIIASVRISRHKRPFARVIKDR